MNDGLIDEIVCVVCLYGVIVVDVVDDIDGKWYGKLYVCY